MRLRTFPLVLLVLATLAPALVGRAVAPAGQYTINGNGTVTDNRTGLIWQQTVTTTTYSHANAITYCANLTLGGSSAWRLPEISELQSLYDACEPTRYDAAVFGAGPTQNVWSNTTYTPDTTHAWSLSNNSFHQAKTSLLVVRCVR